MKYIGRILCLVLCGMLLATVSVWLMRQGRIETLELRPGPQSGVEFAGLDRGKVNINLATREQLEEQLAQACEQRRRLGRVYGALGVTAGAVLMILFV